MTNRHWTDQDRLHQFDLSMRGAEAAFERLGPSSITDNLLSYIEVLFWLGAAIDSMKLQLNSSTIHAGIWFVRNYAYHEQWNLLTVTPQLTYDDAGYDESRYDDWYFDALRSVGIEYDEIESGTQQAGYVRHLEGKSVRMYTKMCFLELQTLRNASVAE